MPEYIERETLINVLEGEIEDCGYADASNKPIAYGTILGLKSALSYAKTLPTADVVEVVRCKDCTNWQRHTGMVVSPNGFCFYHEIQSNGYDFCSYGEKKEGAE